MAIKEQATMEANVDDFIALNQAGQALQLCEKYYAANVRMLNNGEVFAETMREAYDKQKGFVEAVTAFDIRLISKDIQATTATLVFHYQMTTATDSLDFTGKHVQQWKDSKIQQEEYFSLPSV